MKESTCYIDDLDHTQIHWKTIPVNPKYEINNRGIVRHIPSGRLLNKNKSRDGYARQALSNGQGKRADTIFNHRVLGELFLKPVEGSNWVVFDDNDKENTDVRNLRWSNPSESIKRAIASGRFDPVRNSKIGANAATAVTGKPLTIQNADGQVITYPSISAACRAFGISRFLMTKVMSGEYVLETD